MSIMRSILCVTPSSLAFVLGGAHFWRAGQYPFSVGCMLFALLVWRREAWIRQVTLVLLPLLAARWVWAAAQFVQIRMFMEQPWMRCWKERRGMHGMRAAGRGRSCGRRPFSGRSPS